MKEVKILVKAQKKIDFANDCDAIVDYEELENAVLWYSEKPTISKKHIYLHGKYPAVSIGKEKIHIHRLLMMYWLKSKIPSEFSVHHINGNRLDARKENLSVILNSTHASKHNKGKNVTDNVRNRMIAFNHTRKGTRQPHHRKDISYSDVKALLDNGYSLNKIANELGCDWSTVKSRVDDIFDNPELLEVDHE